MDKSYFQNPILEYFKWIIGKIKIQSKYKGKHIKIGYNSIANNTKFDEYNWIGEDVYMENVDLGKFSYVSSNSTILETKIGKFCSIGPNVRIAPGKHPTHTIVSTHPALFSNPDYCERNFQDKDYHNPLRNVTIGNDVWICANAVIADGITIGNGAIIAGNALVNKNVEPYSIVSGIPAKHIRYRFKEEEIVFLEEFKWWDKSLEWIDKNSKLMLDIESLYQKYNQ